MIGRGVHNKKYSLSEVDSNSRRLPFDYSPVILWFDLGLIAREGFSNVSYSALQHTKSLKKFSEGKA